jgi:hypothetical protein
VERYVLILSFILAGCGYVTASDWDYIGRLHGRESDAPRYYDDSGQPKPGSQPGPSSCAPAATGF